MTTLNWTHVQKWIQTNPNRSATLKPFVPTNQSVEGEMEQTDILGWIKLPVSPSTPLSAILLAQDLMYRSVSEGTRYGLLRTETTDCQEKATLHLKGRAWPARRTAEGIAAVGMEEAKASSWTTIGWNAIAALREIQIVIMNETKQTIQFIPEDVRTWSNETEIICVAHDARFVWTHPSSSTTLHKWISHHAFHEWTIDYPLADGTMEELKSAAVKHGIVGKHIKDELRKKIGCAQSIQHILSWSRTVQ